MNRAYTVAQVRAADEKTMEKVSVDELMERAGEALADAVQSAMQRTGAGDALFVCGGGNNGGDGFVAARILSERGEEVSVLCLAARFSPACERAKSRYRGEILGRIPRRRYSLIVDCVLGTGLTRPPEGDAATLIEMINDSGSYVLSCDLPSGLAENGIALSPCVRADETVTMGLMKSALLLCDGADVAGRIMVADIGLCAEEEGAQIWQDSDVKAFFPKKRGNSHKGTFGSACILGGETSGAAFLAADACLKSGAGYTRLYAADEWYFAAVGKLPAAVLRKFSAIDGEILSSDCVALGMGAGAGKELYAKICELLARYTGTLVLDADALTTLGEYGTDVLKNKSCKVILTPHPKEFSRLTGLPVREILSRAQELARGFAREYGVTLVLKNNRSIITDGERIAVNTTGGPVLAKGGSGDVLSGLLAGTCARGIPPFEAACVASYLLGRAGEIAAEKMGEYAPCASDVIGFLPAATLSLN